jgi:hypothetical protein
MTRISRSVWATVLVAANLAACGGSSPTGSNNNGNTTGPMTATIAGQSWVSPYASASFNNQFGGILVIGGTGVSGGITYAVTISLTGVSTAGTYTFTTNASPKYAIVGASNNKGWGTGFQGGSGTITLTTFTANHVVGTFAFTAGPDGSNPANTSPLTVANGKFDVTF